MDLKKLLCFSLCLFFCTGCFGKQITTEQLKSLDFGTCPENYQELITEHFSTRLIDPYSAKFTFEAPIKQYFKNGKQLGWGVCGTFNAKNRFGGYVGAENFWTFISNGKVLKSHTEILARAYCRILHEEQFD